MPFCINCGNEVSEDMKFCPKCGHRLMAEEKGASVDYVEKKVTSWEIEHGEIVLSREDYRKTREIFRDYDGKTFELVTFKGNFRKKHFLYDKRKLEAALACKPFFGSLNDGDVIYLQPIDELRVGIYKDKPTGSASSTEANVLAQEKPSSEANASIEGSVLGKKNKYVPRQIQNILAREELVERDFRVEGRRLYATDRRLLELSGDSIRDFDYAHISSVAYRLKRYLWLIAVGIVLIILGAVLDSLLDSELFLWVFTMIGLILILIGAIHKEEFVEANVVGVSEPIKYKGQRQILHSLLQLIRQKQGAKLEAKEKETKDIDSIEAIRKLAELRDQGILTQEEFEAKKRKLL
jgi:DNA-directed RNA polymerase subunit RPC12/RpoP